MSSVSTLLMEWPCDSNQDWYEKNIPLIEMQSRMLDCSPAIHVPGLFNRIAGLNCHQLASVPLELT